MRKLWNDTVVWRSSRRERRRKKKKVDMKSRIKRLKTVKWIIMKIWRRKMKKTTHKR